MGWFKRFIFKKVLSDWIPLKWIDGYKLEIARWLTLASAVMLAIATAKREWEPWLTQGQALLATIAGFLGIELAKAHKEVKAKEGFGARGAADR